MNFLKDNAIDYDAVEQHVLTIGRMRRRWLASELKKFLRQADPTWKTAGASLASLLKRASFICNFAPRSIYRDPIVPALLLYREAISRALAERNQKRPGLERDVEFRLRTAEEYHDVAMQLLGRRVGSESANATLHQPNQSGASQP